MVVRKRSLALNKCMENVGMDGCGITGIVLWNSGITGALVVEGRISAVRRQVISVNKRRENGPKSVPQRRSMVNRSVVSWKSVYAPPL